MPTISELKELLRQRGLPTSGKKQVLQDRLNEALQQEKSKKRSQPDSCQTNKRQQLFADDPVDEDDPAYSDLFNSIAGNPQALQIEPDQTLALCEQLEVDPEELAALVLSFAFGSTSMGVFPKQAFIKKAAGLRVKSVEDIRALLPSLQEQCKWGGDMFDDLYKFAFAWGCDPGIRNLKKENAIGLWKLLISSSAFSPIDSWLEYWDARKANIVTKDEWFSFRRFIQEFNLRGSFENFELGDAWPLTIDDFVEKMLASSHSST